MPALRSDILLLDGLGNGSANISGALGEGFDVEFQSLKKAAAQLKAGAKLYIFYANLASIETFDLVKNCARRCAGETLFVLPTHNSASISRAHDLGNAEPFILPLNPQDLQSAVKAALNRRVEASWSELSPAQHKALTASLSCFRDCFDRIRRGEPLPMNEIEESCHQICESAKVGKLNDWVGGLQGHHDYSFRHSMFVCGSLTYFANSLGVRGAELERVTVGGMIHDIGKSYVPLEILDKAGKLDDEEWKVMRQHPEYSRDILANENGLDKVVVEMAVHHHEKIDGGGYPDGLSGAAIDDHVRLTAICDVYSALIERRSYKKPMTNEAAVDLMATFEGHLDMDLLRAFREFVLDKG